MTGTPSGPIHASDLLPDGQANREDVAAGTAGEVRRGFTALAVDTLQKSGVADH